MSQDFCYALLVKKTISEMRIHITLFHPMLVCDELEETIVSYIQSAAEEAELQEVLSAIDGRVRTAVCSECKLVINLIRGVQSASTFPQLCLNFFLNFVKLRKKLRQS